MTQIYYTQSFSLSIKPRANHMNIEYRSHDHNLLTSSFPQTLPLLKRHLPSVLKTTCFNPKNDPFQEEVKNTEVAHLFEHILLDYCVQQKLLSGAERATFKGLTCWNWNRDPRGTFAITVSVAQSERDLFFRALQQATLLMEELLSVGAASN